MVTAMKTLNSFKICPHMKGFTNEEKSALLWSSVASRVKLGYTTNWSEW